MTLSRDLRITISGLAKNIEEKCDLEIMTKEKKLDFHHTLALGLRKRFTLVNHLLTQLSDIDPVLICNEKSALKKMAEKMSNYLKSEEKGSIISELGRLQMNIDDFRIL